MNIRPSLIPVLGLACGVLVASASRAPAAETVQEVRDCLAKNMPQDSSVQTIVMNAKDRIGAVTKTRARIYWRKFEDDLSRALVRLSDPPDMRGAALLLIQKKDENDMFMYLPELKRVKRVTGPMMSGSMFGTDFSYDEFENLQGLADDDVSEKLLPDGEVQGRPAYVIEARANPDADPKPSYERTVTYVDKATCVPLQVDFFERGDEPRKRLVGDVASLEKSGDRNLLRRIEISDLRDGTSTELVVEDIELNADVKRSMFSARKLSALGGKTF